jgi:hypothetical protein
LNLIFYFFKYLAPEIGRGGSDRRPHYDTNRNAGSGFGQNERQGKGEKNNPILLVQK